MPPRIVGPYEVLSVVGRGGIATVCRARDRRSGQIVALKLVGPPPACDPGAARRLAREYEALEGLDHPNVVRVHEAGVYEGYSFLAMELVNGLDLRSYLSPALDDRDAEPIRSRTPLPSVAGELDTWSWSDEPQTEGLPAPDEVAPVSTGPGAIRAFAALMDEPETEPPPEPPHPPPVDPAPTTGAGSEPRPPSPAVLERLNHPRRMARLRSAIVQVCDGLSYVHAHGLVHRDLKPSNIMVDDTRRVRLMDFGLVKLASDAGKTRDHGSIVGTYRYMAPEQARGDPLDHRADLYSLGVILFELACGRPPFTQARSAGRWDAIMSRTAPSVRAINAGVDPRLAYVIERLLATAPQERFQSAADVASALRG